jgi:imidazolonepropionase
MLAAEFGALSVDHLEYLDALGVAAIARSGTVATLLPGAFYYLGETQKPPVDELRSAGVPIAVASDLNPGTSPVHSLLTAMNMSCVLFGLTPEEALRGVTSVAAKALALSDRGEIALGLRADLAIWNITNPGELAYPLGLNPLKAVLNCGALAGGALP